MLRKIVDTGGENVVMGLRNLVHDIRHNHMLPSQVDATPFKVGVNVATTPGQVVHRSEMFELIQYAPSTGRVHARPLVMSPPQVNKFYAIDLAPEKSLLKWTWTRACRCSSSVGGIPPSSKATGASRTT